MSAPSPAATTEPAGVPLAVTTTGTGPPLVLVHGTGDDAGCWAAVTTRLSDRYTVHSVHRRGRGGSGDAGEHSIAAEARDIADVVGGAGPGCTLVAHSYGAICALEAARRTPPRRMVLYEPPIPVPGSPDLTAVAAEIRLACRAGRDEEALGLFLVRVTGMDPALYEMVRRIPGFRQRAGFAATLAREIETTQSYVPDPDALRRVRVPTLLLAGDRSPAPLRAATALLHDLLGRSEVAVLAGQGHRAVDTAPGLFADAVLRFISREDDPR